MLSDNEKFEPQEPDSGAVQISPTIGLEATMLDHEKCWKAILAKDKSQDGQFFFGVLTIGVYCRPSCPARAPLRKNVRFYRSRAEAEKDGLRACLRCRPAAVTSDDAMRLRVRRLCEYIRLNCQSGEPLALHDLAQQIGLSPFHLQRTFKAFTGVTPKEYVEACRLRALKNELRDSDSVTTAIYQAGFGSSSRVYERVNDRLGMTPAQYRAGGKGVAISYVEIESPLGPLLLAATDRGLCFLQFGDSHESLSRQLQKEYPAALIQKVAAPYPEQLAGWIDALRQYLRREKVRLDLPIDVPGTAFQMKVWKYLQSIPYGEVQSYSEVANAIGQPQSARAVARACAANQVALVVPCHRVIRGSGDLAGYRWGLERKRMLLDQERAVAAGAAK